MKAFNFKVKNTTHLSAHDLFKGNTRRLKLFKFIKKYIESLGPCYMKITKTQVSIRSKRQFAWIWPPPLVSKKRPENCVVLSFSLSKRIENPYIVESLEPFPGRWMHHVVIEKESDLNQKVKTWIQNAYDDATNSSSAHADHNSSK